VGQSLGVPDAIIAATAIGHHLTLVTLNQGDFRHIAGLSLFAMDERTGI
jgi:predicted nucleic acid-binding protein